MALNVNEIQDRMTQGYSIREIAAELGTYPNKIRRLLIKNGIEIPSSSEVYENKKKNNRLTPQEKKPTSLETKIKQSKIRTEFWQMANEETKKKIREQGKRSQKIQKDLKKKANNAIRKTAERGSRLEHYVVGFLNKQGILVEFHKKGLLLTDLEVDIYLPEYKVAVEIDGLSHFEPIWGEDRLQKTQEADRKKNGILLTHNIHVVRIKNKLHNHNLYKYQVACEELLEHLNNLPSEPNVINIEVQND